MLRQELFVRSLLVNCSHRKQAVVATSIQYKRTPIFTLLSLCLYIAYPTLVLLPVLLSARDPHDVPRATHVDACVPLLREQMFKTIDDELVQATSSWRSVLQLLLRDLAGA